jgi:hypothetical protein
LTRQNELPIHLGTPHSKPIQYQRILIPVS